MDQWALPPCDLDSLGEEITTLSAHINAAAARRYAMVAEFDRRGGWAGAGMLSCAHWLELRCGETPANAKELVRAGRALEELPLVREAFSRGAISESAVRKITGAATRETEDVFLQFACYGTGSQLDRLCRHWRQVLARNGPQTPLGRWMRFRYDDDGSLRLSGRLPGDEGELVRQAIQRVLDEAEQTPAAGGPDEPAAEEPAFAVDDSALRRAEYRAGLRELSRELGLPLDYEEDDESAFSDAANDGGDQEEDGDLPRNTTLADLFTAQGDYEQRCADALVELASRSLHGTDGTAPAPERYQVVVHVDLDVLAGRRDGLCELERGMPVSAEIARMLFCDADLVGVVQDEEANPLYVGTRTRLVRGKMRRALHARDRMCRFPSCGTRSRTQAHHLDPYARGGATRLPNLITLCRAHHAKWHAGEYTIESPSPGTFVFRHPAGWQIGRTDAPIGDHPRPTVEARMPIEAQNAAAGLHIDSRTGVPRYYGDRCDWSTAIDGLARRAGLAAVEPATVDSS